MKWSLLTSAAPWRTCLSIPQTMRFWEMEHELYFRKGRYRKIYWLFAKPYIKIFAGLNLNAWPHENNPGFWQRKRSFRRKKPSKVTRTSSLHLTLANGGGMDFLMIADILQKIFQWTYHGSKRQIIDLHTTHGLIVSKPYSIVSFERWTIGSSVHFKPFLKIICC